MSIGNLQYHSSIASASVDMRCILHSPLFPSKLLKTYVSFLISRGQPAKLAFGFLLELKKLNEYPPDCLHDNPYLVPLLQFQAMGLWSVRFSMAPFRVSISIRARLAAAEQSSFCRYLLLDFPFCKNSDDHPKWQRKRTSKHSGTPLSE